MSAGCGLFIIVNLDSLLAAMIISEAMIKRL